MKEKTYSKYKGKGYEDMNDQKKKWRKIELKILICCFVSVKFSIFCPFSKQEAESIYTQKKSRNINSVGLTGDASFFEKNSFLLEARTFNKTQKYSSIADKIEFHM